jgi:hypothetical protein
VDTQEEKRPIVVGVHRTTILTNECDDNNSTKPQAEILECYTSAVALIFPCDSIHL